MECLCFRGAWNVSLTEGEYCFTLSSRVDRRGQATSRSQLLVLNVLVIRDVGVPWFPRGGEGGVRAVLVGLGWGVEKGSVVSSSLAALSSGAWRLVAVVIP
jgi:hypothetical protein